MPEYFIAEQDPVRKRGGPRYLLVWSGRDARTLSCGPRVRLDAAFPNRPGTMYPGVDGMIPCAEEQGDSNYIAIAGLLHANCILCRCSSSVLYLSLYSIQMA